MKRAVWISILCCTAATAASITQPKFSARRDYPGAGGVEAVAGVNGDGIPDVVAVQNENIVTLLGNGTVRFGLALSRIRGAARFCWPSFRWI